MNNILNILSYLTIRKITNMLLLSSSYIISAFLKKPIQKGKPLSISVEPTNFCNLNCPECISGQRKFTRSTGNMKLELYKNIIDQTHKFLAYHILYFQGEPYLHNDFFKMIEYANSKKIFTATSTNGHFLDNNNAKRTIKSGLDKIIISIDGVNSKTYNIYRKNGDFNKVIEGTKNLVEWKKKLKSKKPYIVVQFLVTKQNQHQIKEMKQMAKSLHINKIEFKTIQLYDYINGNKLMPDIKKYTRYKKQEDGKYSIKNKLKNRCWRMWSSSVICHDGKLVPCCFDKDADFVLGDATQQTITEIWTSDKYKQFRSKILKNRKNIEICRNCTE